MNRFFNIPGFVSTALAPWEARNRGLKWTTPHYELTQMLRFRSDVAEGVLFIAAPAVSDLASIPRAAWSVFMAPADPRIALGAWFHDDIYKKRGAVLLEDGRTIKLTRKQADHILAFEAMPDLMATRTQQHEVYQALRKFGQQWPGNRLGERLS